MQKRKKKGIKKEKKRKEKKPMSYRQSSPKEDILARFADFLATLQCSVLLCGRVQPTPVGAKGRQREPEPAPLANVVAPDLSASVSHAAQSLLSPRAYPHHHSDRQGQSRPRPTIRPEQAARSSCCPLPAPSTPAGQPSAGKEAPPTVFIALPMTMEPSQ